MQARQRRRISVRTGYRRHCHVLARWLRSDALLAALEGPTVACGSADSLRAFRRHVSDSAPHVVPDACGFVTATEAEREPERQRECPDDPHEEDVDECRRHADLR